VRGADKKAGLLFISVDLESLIPPKRPLRAIRAIVDEAPPTFDAGFSGLSSRIGRLSILPGQLLRAVLPQRFYTVRSERLPVERNGDGAVVSTFIPIAAGASRARRLPGAGAWPRAREPPTEDEIRNLFGMPRRLGALDVVTLGTKAEHKPDRPEQGMRFGYEVSRPSHVPSDARRCLPPRKSFPALVFLWQLGDDESWLRTGCRTRHSVWRRRG
jgi:hypothetical protein